VSKMVAAEALLAAQEEEEEASQKQPEASKVEAVSGYAFGSSNLCTQPSQVEAYRHQKYSVGTREQKRVARTSVSLLAALSQRNRHHLVDLVNLEVVVVAQVHLLVYLRMCSYFYFHLNLIVLNE
jgi:hypothetical protein